MFGQISISPNMTLLALSTQSTCMTQSWENGYCEMGTNIQTGDRVGIALTRIDPHTGKEVGSKIACEGLVVRIYQPSRLSHWRAEIIWDDPQKGWLYTGKDNWEYLTALTLVHRELHQPIRRGRPIEQKPGYRGRIE